MKQIDQKTVSAGDCVPQFDPGTPFLVAGCMVFRCIGGRASFLLNFRRYDIGPGDFVFLFNDMVIELGERSSDFTIRYLSVTEEHALEIYVSITAHSFWDALYLSPVQVFQAPLLESVENWIDECVFVCDQCSRATSGRVIVRRVISMFMILEELMGRDAAAVSVQSFGSQWKISGSFLVLLSRNYRHYHHVSFYADALHITSDYLSAIVRSCIGRPPKELIEDKLILAMKALLESTTMPIKAIAERLHYEDTSHMCKVFRRHTGISPMTYRSQRIR